MEFGVQLFSMRSDMKDEKGVENVFKFLQKIGVKNIQLSGGVQLSAERYRELTDKYGLVVTCTHRPFDRIRNDLDKLIEEHKIMGCDTLGLGMMPRKYRENNYALLDEFCDIMQKASVKLKEKGMYLAYHNHAFEYDMVGDKRVLDILIERVPDLQFILDTYWTKFAGVDIVPYIEKMTGRLRRVHFKDYRKILGLFPFFGDVGYGEIDFKSLIPIFEKAGTEYALIEKDVSLNNFRSIARSWKYLSNL